MCRAGKLVCEHGRGAEPQLPERKGKSKRTGRERNRAVLRIQLANMAAAPSRRVGVAKKDEIG